MLLIMMPDQYPNYYNALEIYTGYFDSLDNMILFSLSQHYRNNERLLYMKSAVMIMQTYVCTQKQHTRYDNHRTC